MPAGTLWAASVGHCRACEACSVSRKYRLVPSTHRHPPASSPSSERSFWCLLPSGARQPVLFTSTHPIPAVKTRHSVSTSCSPLSSCCHSVEKVCMPCWQTRGRCKLWTCHDRLQTHGRPCFILRIPHKHGPCRFVMFHAVSRAISLWIDPGHACQALTGCSTALGQASRGSLEFVNLVDHTTLSPSTGAAGCRTPLSHRNAPSWGLVLHPVARPWHKIPKLCYRHCWAG